MCLQWHSHFITEVSDRSYFDLSVGFMSNNSLRRLEFSTAKKTWIFPDFLLLPKKLLSLFVRQQIISMFLFLLISTDINPAVWWSFCYRIACQDSKLPLQLKKVGLEQSVQLNFVCSCNLSPCYFPAWIHIQMVEMRSFWRWSVNSNQSLKIQNLSKHQKGKR